MRIANKIPVLSYCHRSQMRVFLKVKVEVIFFLKNHFSCQFCVKAEWKLVLLCTYLASWLTSG